MKSKLLCKAESILCWILRVWTLFNFVKSRFLKLNSGHAEYVMGCMRETVTRITNIKAYLITALYNAPSTMNHYYQQEVQHDMYGRGWAEKRIT